MRGYALLVMVLRFIVEMLLLLGADRLYPGMIWWDRFLLGAAIAGVYAGACLLPGFVPLSGSIGRILCLSLVALLAYGTSGNGLRKGAVFLLLNMALDGVSSGFNKDSIIILVTWAALTVVLCVIGFHGRGSKQYVPVEITHQGKCLRLTALCDTGNTLVDPVTGRPVLVVGAEAAVVLTGLTHRQLCTPLETMVTAKIPGLRLIPYHTVGQSTGFMLGLHMQNVRINGQKDCGLVAFAPEGLAMEGTHQALTGGAVS